MTITIRKMATLTQNTLLRASSWGPSPAAPDWLAWMMNAAMSLMSWSVRSGYPPLGGIEAVKPPTPDFPFVMVSMR